MKRYSSIRNGKKGGRRAYGADSSKFNIPDITFVILTEMQYIKLAERYGKQLFNKALNILENWLKSNPASRGKNNYAYFRADGWVINEAKQNL